MYQTGFGANRSLCIRKSKKKKPVPLVVFCIETIYNFIRNIVYYNVILFESNGKKLHSTDKE